MFFIVVFSASFFPSLDGAFPSLEAERGKDEPLGGLHGPVEVSLVLGQPGVDLHDVQASEAAASVNLFQQGQAFPQGHSSGNCKNLLSWEPDTLTKPVQRSQVH